MHREISRHLKRTLALAFVLLPALAHSGPNANLPVPPSGWDELQAVPHGTLNLSVPYPTRNHGEMTFSIHLPPGYSESAQYPVLYLLHGITDDQTTWTSGSKGRAHHILDNLYAQDTARPMIVVMPDGAVGAQGFENAEGYATFEDVLIGDLIPYIEANYAASSHPLLRGLAGLSMGGGQTLNFGFKHYTVFSWIGAFSSAPNTIPAGQTIQDTAAINDHVRFIYLSCGTEDGLLQNTVDYHEFLDANDIGPHVYNLEQGEAHSWEAFNRSLYHFVPNIFTETPPTALRPQRLTQAGTDAKRLIHRNGRVVLQGGDLNGLFTLDGKRVPRGTRPVPD